MPRARSTGPRGRPEPSSGDRDDGILIDSRLVAHDFARLLAPSLLLTALAGCTPQGDPSIGPEGFVDDFERARLGDAWNNTGGPWVVREGRLRVRGAHNHPLWLRRTLPRDVRIEFDAQSDS